ncbi:MAG: hypothetical protein IBX48_08895, partial [Thiomicrospira sp.]|uniref:hypothetical protein n=1 Tax=Thiomicrospira sp. TaxID=935 RepID=UPI0019D958FD
MKNRPLYWVVALTIVLFFALLWLAPTNHTDVNQAQLPWNASYDEQGQLHALGLVLNQSTLKDVTELYGRDIEVKLFEMQDGSKSAEAYLGSAYIGTIHGALVIKLALTEQELEQFYDRGARTTISKQGARQIQLNNADTLALFEFPINEVTLVPRRNLSSESIVKRFGEAHEVQELENGLQRWLYPQMGLELVLLEGSNDILRYRQTN